MADITIITEEMLRNISTMKVISGLILCREYAVDLTKKGDEYIKGSLFSGIPIQFKAWNNSDAFLSLKNADYQGFGCYISGKVDSYMGSYSITLDNIQAADIDISQFLPTRYDKDNYWNALLTLFNQNTSPEIQEIIPKIFTDDIREDFCMEFAAKSHHDACKSGLLAHTYKVMILLTNLLNLYPNLTKNDQKYKDTLYLGVFLHDIGKINEMELGVYQPDSFVTHRYFGLTYIEKHKDELIEKLGETNYYHLVSIITQHHGKYGEPCQTLASYIVHFVDNMDSIWSVVTEDLANGKTVLSVDEYKLNV